MNPTSHAPWFLGIDLGTGSCKCLVVDHSARPLGFGSSDYITGGDFSRSNVQERWNEQDPGAALAGLVRAVRAAIQSADVRPKDCAGMSIGSALHTVLAVDREDRPLTGAMTWADDRAALQARAARKSEAYNDLYSRTGCPIHWMYPLYKIAWLHEEQPRVFEKCAHFIPLKEFILHQLTGEHVIDYSVAAGSGLLNQHNLDWEEKSLILAGISREQLSPLADPLMRLPPIRPHLAEEMGLLPETPFYLGSSDAANSSLGAGAPHSWQATCMVGTSGALRLISPRPVMDARGRSFCYAVDASHWMVGGALNNGGVAVSWLRDLLNTAFPSRPDGMQLSYEDVMALAEKAPPGAQGLICLPFFAGERSPNWNLDSRAVFFGLTLKHDARHMARALLEGLAFRLHSLNDVLGEVATPVTQIRASGGFTHSPLWLQIIASALERDLVVPEVGETSSLGAAFWAMRGAGVLSSLEDIEPLVQVKTVIHPIEEQIAVYSRLYTLYQQLYQANSPYFSDLAAL